MKLSDFVKIIPPTVRATIFRCEFWHASIGEAEARGSSADEACSRLRKIVAGAFGGDYAPTVILCLGNYVGVVWRTPYHWTYCIKRTDVTDTIYGVNRYDTKQEAIDAMKDQAACMESE